MILYGGYAHGAFKPGTPEAAPAYQATVELARVAWAQDNPTFRRCSPRFIPTAVRSISSGSSTCASRPRSHGEGRDTRARGRDIAVLLVMPAGRASDRLGAVIGSVEKLIRGARAAAGGVAEPE